MNGTADRDAGLEVQAGNAVSAVVFDFDGLLMDTESTSLASWRYEWSGHLERAGVAARFEVLACGDEVAGHKPAPDVYLLALDRLGVGGSRAAAVEDTVHGVTAAQAAGMRCIAIPNPFADRSRFGAANLVLASAAEMSLSQALSSLR